MTEADANPDILCVGYVNWDVVLNAARMPEPDTSEELTDLHEGAGGSATNTALGLQSLGGDAAIFGGVGADDYADRIRDTLTAVGVTPALTTVEAGTTVVYGGHIDADPWYLVQNQAPGTFGRQDIPPAIWDAVDHVHVTSFDAEIGGDIAHAATTDGKTVSFNPSQTYPDEPCTAAVQAADLIILNENEIELLDARQDLDTVLADTTVVVTHGADGSVVYTPDGDDYTTDGVTVATVKDPVGAGDAFTAGFLRSWLAGDPVQTALATGSAAGAYAVTRFGAPNRLDTDWITDRAATCSVTRLDD